MEGRGQSEKLILSECKYLVTHTEIYDSESAAIRQERRLISGCLIVLEEVPSHGHLTSTQTSRR